MFRHLSTEIDLIFICWYFIKRQTYYIQKRMEKDNVHLFNHSLNSDYYERYTQIGKDISYTKLGRYTVYQQIGQGGFGKVYRGLSDNDGSHIAIKTLEIRKIHEKTNIKLKEIELRLVKNEDIVMRICNSPNLMKCYDVYENKDIKIMILQFCNGGTLQDYISKRGKIFEEEALAILRQILNGIKELHSKNIVHRDLKAQNILVHNELFKIADFGFSEALEKQYDGVTCLGTITNMAPQIMKRQRYGLKADIWSIGIILFQMVFGCYPFNSKEKQALINQIYNSPIHKRQRIIFKNYMASVQMSNLIKQMLQPDQYRRIGWQQLIEHKIFTKNLSKLPRSIIPSVPLNLSACRDLQVIKENHEQINNTLLSDVQIDIKDSTLQLLKKMSKQSIEILTKQHQKEQNHHFYSTKNYLFQCLKNELIYNEIICAIQQNKMLDISQRKVVQFLFVLASRCYINMSNIVSKLKKDESKYTYIASVLNPCSLLYNKIKIKFDEYSYLLRQQQDSILGKIGDAFRSLAFKQQIEKVNKYLNGISGHDYKHQEHLQFIESYYINTLKGQLAGSEDVKLKVKSFMIHYRQINLVDFKDIKGMDFDAYVQQLIKK